jgi:hypothetical protein
MKEIIITILITVVSLLFFGVLEAAIDIDFPKGLDYIFAVIAVALRDFFVNHKKKV